MDTEWKREGRKRTKLAEEAKTIVETEEAAKAADASRGGERAKNTRTMAKEKGGTKERINCCTTAQSVEAYGYFIEYKTG